MTVTRRSTVAVVSVLIHLTVLAALLLVSMLGSELLPAPHGPVLAWQQPTLVQLADIELKPDTTPRRQATPSTRAPQPTRLEAAPVVASDTIRPETGREGGPFIARELSPPVSSIEGIDVGQIESVPEPPAVRREPMRMHSGINAPRKLVDAAPGYPEIARASRVQGIVILEATISETGDVISARVLRSVPLLDQAAVDAVRRWKFEPARLNGEAVPVVMTVTVNFRLD